MTPNEAANPPRAERTLADLETEWAARFAREPKLPTPALLCGAMAMACGFGAVMFLAFAWARGFEAWVPQLAIFSALALSLGLLNRYFARRWYREVRRWSEERAALATELERRRKT